MSEPVIVDLPEGFPKEIPVTLERTATREFLSAPFEWNGVQYLLRVPTHHPSPVEGEVWVVAPWSLNRTGGYVYAPAQRRVSTKSGKPLVFEVMEQIKSAEVRVWVGILLCGNSSWVRHQCEGVLQSMTVVGGILTIEVGKTLHRIERSWSVGRGERPEREYESLTFTCPEEHTSRVVHKQGHTLVMCSKNAEVVTPGWCYGTGFGESFCLEFR